MRKLSQLVDNSLRKRVEVIIQDANGNLMLGRHPKGGAWLFPGGGIDEGEDALQAAKREAAEEVGLQIEPLRLIGDPFKSLALANATKHTQSGSLTQYVLAKKISDELAANYGADKDKLLEIGFRPKQTTIDLLKSTLERPDTADIVKNRLGMVGLI